MANQLLSTHQLVRPCTQPHPWKLVSLHFGKGYVVVYMYLHSTLVVAGYWASTIANVQIHLKYTTHFLTMHAWPAAVCNKQLSGTPQ